MERREPSSREVVVGEGKGLPRSPASLACPGWLEHLQGFLSRSMLFKSIRGVSLGLGFSHVYLEADVTLCQPRAPQRSHTRTKRLPLAL